MSTKATGKGRYCIIGNEGYGLYVGWVRDTDESIVRRKSVRVYECRHVCEWHGGTGGITSLAAWGPCGPDASKSLIGEPCPTSLITEVKAVHDCTPEAKEAFDSIKANKEP